MNEYGGIGTIKSVGGIGGGIHVQYAEDWMSSHTHRSRSSERSVVELTNETKKFTALRLLHLK